MYLSSTGIRGAEEDADQLILTDELLQAVLAEAWVVCTGQPVLIAGDLNADPAVIPCLAKAISEGRFVDLALAYSLGERKRPAATCKFKLDECSGSRLDFILACPNAVAASTACMVTDWWFPHHFSLFAAFDINGWSAEVSCPFVSSLCGWPAGLTLRIGLLHLVLFRIHGMCIEMNLVLYLLTLYLLCGMRFPGLRLMIFGPFGAKIRRLVYSGHIVGQVVPLLLAAVPFWEEVCYEFAVGVLGVELLVAGDRAGCIRVSQGDDVDVHCAQYFVNSSLAPVVLFRRRLQSVADVLEGIRNKGFTQSRFSALLGYGSCGPISSLRPWDDWIPPDLHGFYRWVFDSLEVLNGFIKQVVDNTRECGGSQVD